MAFKRACRAGEMISIPALSDDTFETAAHGLMVREAEGLPPEDVPAFMTRRAGELRAQVSLFAEMFDESVIQVPLDGVARVMIQGLSGAQFADAESAGYAAAVRANVKAEHVQAYLELEILRRGLVSVEGFDAAPAGCLYPVDVLMGPNGIGLAWARFRVEMAARITAWSHLGKPESSSSAP